MRDEFSKHQCPGQEWCRLLEAARRTVSRSFSWLVFVVSRSVMLAELSCVICGGIVLLPQVYVRVYACVYIWSRVATVSLVCVRCFFVFCFFLTIN